MADTPEAVIRQRWRLATQDVSPTLVAQTVMAFCDFIDYVPSVPTPDECSRPTAQLTALEAALARLRAASRFPGHLPVAQTAPATLYQWGLVVDANNRGVD